MVHCMRGLNGMFISDHNDHNYTLVPNRNDSVIDDIIKGYLLDKIRICNFKSRLFTLFSNLFSFTTITNSGYLTHPNQNRIQIGP